jgi:hypothetical protein
MKAFHDTATEFFAGKELYLLRSSPSARQRVGVLTIDCGFRRFIS